MSDRRKLIDSIVSFRMGHWHEHGDIADIDDVVDHVRKDRAMGTVALYDASKRHLHDLNGYGNRIVRELDYWSMVYKQWGSDMRVANFCTYLDNVNATGKFVMAFTDAAYWTFNEAPGTPGYPVIQFARHRDDHKAVLFPLDFKYMGAGSANLPLDVSDLDMPFDQKKDAAIWRGRLSGTIRVYGRTVHAERLAKSFLAAGSDEEFERIVVRNLHYNRLRLCHLYHGTPDIDVGITGPGDLTLDEGRAYFEWPSARRILGSRKTIREQLGHRYIICMPGNDFPSGLYWALASNSAVLMPEPLWLTPLDFGLRAWEHYVPIAEDLSDIPAMMEWCRANPQAVQEMISRAKSYCRILCDVEIRDEADRIVIDRYVEIVRARRPKPISYASDRFLSQDRMVGPGRTDPAPPRGGLESLPSASDGALKTSKEAR